MTFAVLLVFGGFYGVKSASANDSGQATTSQGESHVHGHRGDHSAMMKKYQSEFKQLHQARKTSFEYMKQIHEKNDQALELALSGNASKDALKKAQGIHKTIKANNEKLKQLKEQLMTCMKAFRKAAEGQDDATAKKNITEMVQLSKQATTLLEKNNSLYDQLITTLKK